MKIIKKLFFSYHNYRFRKKRNRNVFRKFSKKKVEKLYNLNATQKKIILATQVGRGGGKWLADMINHCKNVSAFGERHRLEESLFRHNCSYKNFEKSNNLIHIIKSEALSDWRLSKITYISSPYFSHGIKFLDKKLNPNKFVIIIRDYYGLLYSLLNKGWYKENIIIDLNKYHNYPNEIFKNKPNHFFGRYINLNKYNKVFFKSSRPVKVAIFMLQTLKTIYKDASKLDKNKLVIFNLNKADQNFTYCKSFLKKLNVNLNMDKSKFLGLKKRTSVSIENEKVSIEKKDKKKIRELRDEYNEYLNKIKLLI